MTAIVFILIVGGNECDLVEFDFESIERLFALEMLVRVQLLISPSDLVIAEPKELHHAYELHPGPD